MKRPALLELLLHIQTQHPTVRLIVAGSQAIYAHARSAPDVVELSMEADLLLVHEAFQARSDIELNFGMNSPFQAEMGLYAHPVGLGTITLPSGWEPRLLPFGRSEGLHYVWALEIHDLAASKLMAGREKDFVFLRVLLERDLCAFPTLLERMELFRASVFANALPDRLEKLAGHLREWRRDDLAGAVARLLRP